MELRELQKTWLKDMLARTGTTATDIARRAGLSSSTLTRFLNSEDAHNTLSSRTIAVVEQALREVLSRRNNPDAFTPAPATFQSATGFSESDSSLYIPQDEGNALDAAIAAFIQNRQGIDPWVINTRVLEMAGILPGDIALVDLNAVPQAGDVVYAQLYDWRTMTAETIVRLYEPPFLVSASLDTRTRKPTLVDSDNVAIKGVMIGMIRPRSCRE